MALLLFLYDLVKFLVYYISNYFPVLKNPYFSIKPSIDENLSRNIHEISNLPDTLTLFSYLQLLYKVRYTLRSDIKDIIAVYKYVQTNPERITVGEADSANDMITESNVSKEKYLAEIDRLTSSKEEAENKIILLNQKVNDLIIESKVSKEQYLAEIDRLTSSLEEAENKIILLNQKVNDLIIESNESKEQQLIEIDRLTSYKEEVESKILILSQTIENNIKSKYKIEIDSLNFMHKHEMELLKFEKEKSDNEVIRLKQLLHANQNIQEKQEQEIELLKVTLKDMAVKYRNELDVLKLDNVTYVSDDETNSTLDDEIALVPVIESLNEVAKKSNLEKYYMNKISGLNHTIKCDKQDISIKTKQIKELKTKVREIKEFYETKIAKIRSKLANLKIHYHIALRENT